MTLYFSILTCAKAEDTQTSNVVTLDYCGLYNPVRIGILYQTT